MDILLVINPFSPCTEFSTICSQRRYLLGVLSDNRTGRVLSEIFNLIKWFWWLRWWRDCNIYCYDHPAQDDIMGNAGGSHDIFAQKRYKMKESELALSSARIWHLDCSIHVLYKTLISIDRVSRDNRSTSLTRARTNGLEHYVWLHQVSLINQLWHRREWQATFENITARYFWGSRNILHVNLTPVKITTINKFCIGFRSGEIITLSSRFFVAIKTTFASQEAVKQANNRINRNFLDCVKLEKNLFSTNWRAKLLSDRVIEYYQLSW